MLKALIFDLDETLISSKDLLLRFFYEMYEHIGEPFPHDREADFYMLPEKGFLEHMLDDPEKLAAAREFKNSYDTSRHVLDLRLKPFAREALDYCKERYRLAVATNRGPTTPAVLEHFGITELFEEVVHARTLDHPKPHPVIVESILKRLEASTDEALLIGDSEIDVQTADNGGIPSLIVGENASSGIGDFQLADLSGLPELLQELD